MSIFQVNVKKAKKYTYNLTAISFIDKETEIFQSNNTSNFK